MNTNFYTILDCKISSSEDEINTNYKKKIKSLVKQLDNLEDKNNSQQINQINELLQKIKNDIKLLKTSKFILTDQKLRKKYNSILKNGEDKNQIMEIESNDNTASRRDLKLDFDKRSEKLSKRIFQKFDFEE
tara:strand:+ start:84 stop:479 length:396 start_codon:yes stop_codon:yes gene_type:complete